MEREKFGKSCKQHMMDEVEAHIKERPNIFITNYMGLSTSELESLRRDMRKSSANFFVVKNSLTKKVLQKLKLDDAAALVDGGVGLGLAGDDFIAASKILVKFAKEHSMLKIKAAVLDGKLVSEKVVSDIASLPSREIVLAWVVGTIQAPIAGFVRVLAGVLRKFVYCVDAIKSAKEAKPS